MLRDLFYGLLIYLAFRVVYDLIVPVFQATRHIKTQFGRMQDAANQARQQANDRPSDPGVPPKASAAKAGDYIDFEEVKS